MMRLRQAHRFGTAIVALGPALVVAGCSGASVTEALQPVVEFELQGTVESGTDARPTVTSTAPGAAVLEGVISTPNPCYGFDASIAAAGGTLTLTIAATRQTGMCIQVLGQFAYQARIGGLARGSYPVNVRYTFPGTGWEERVFQLRLNIP